MDMVGNLKMHGSIQFYNFITWEVGHSKHSAGMGRKGAEGGWFVENERVVWVFW